MLDVLQHYRSSYLLHAFVLMPDHIHLLLTPQESLERAMQKIKGGFSYQAKREFNWQEEVWQKGFSDHRIRDFGDRERHIGYIKMNPVKARLSESPEGYGFSFLSGRLAMDSIPQRLKPSIRGGDDGGAEAPPLQNAGASIRGAAEAPPLRGLADGGVESPLLQNETAPVQAVSQMMGRLR